MAQEAEGLDGCAIQQFLVGTPRGDAVTDFRPAEAALLQGCIVATVVIVMLAALLALWVRRGK